MRYKTIKDLPYVFQLNLPEAALHVFKDAFNRAWAERGDESAARRRAIEAVRQRFTKNEGRWIELRSAAVSAAGEDAGAPSVS